MVDRLFRTKPAEQYLPYALASDGVGMRAGPDFVWPIPGSHFFDAGGRRSQLWTMLEPDSFPEFAWKPSRTGYDRVRAMLMKDDVVSPEFHLSLPCAVTAPLSLAAVCGRDEGQGQGPLGERCRQEHVHVEPEGSDVLAGSRRDKLHGRDGFRRARALG